MTQNILIDTSIALEGGEELIAKLEKVAPVFVTDIVLQELDGKKGAEGSVGYNAREFFRKLGRDNGVEIFVLPPNNVKLEKTDTLRKMTLGVTPIYVIVRKPYKSRDINDSKIIEIAKDYNMKLVTLDMAQRVRAMSEGIDVCIIEKKDDKTVKNFTISKLFFLFLSMASLLIMPTVYFNLELFARKSSIENIAFSIVVFFCLFLLFVLLKYAFIGGKEKANNNSYENFDSNNSDNLITDPSKSYMVGNLFHDSLHG